MFLAAFDALHEKYKNILLRMAYLISGQMFDAEDVAQEMVENGN